MDQLTKEEIQFCQSGKFDQALVMYCQRTSTSAANARSVILQHLQSKGNPLMKNQSVAYAPKVWASYLLNGDPLPNNELILAQQWKIEKAEMGLFPVDIIPDDADEQNYAYLMRKV